MPALVSFIAASTKEIARSRWPPLLGVARISSARAACREPKAACMGDLGRKRGIEAILQTLNRRVFPPAREARARHAATVPLFGAFEFSSMKLEACISRRRI